MLVLIEPGTPAGSRRILAARQALVAEGAYTVAPCPHDGPCPLAAGDWCHFAQRVERTRLHRQAKAAELSYEDEKFSHVALTRREPPVPTGRVIRRPQPRGGHVLLHLCLPEGTRERIVTRREGEAFRQARHSRWGDAWPLPGVAPQQDDEE